MFDVNRCVCKDCRREYRNKRERDAERVLIRKQRRNSKSSEISDSQKRYYIKNRDVILKRVREYRKNNRDKINSYIKNKKKTNILFYITSILRRRMAKVIAEAKSVKSENTAELLGCDIKTLKDWLESKFLPGMTWDNRGDAWHIDHIIPCASFDLTKPDEQKACFHYTNLQPLWATDNIKKSDKIQVLTSEGVFFV